jgi:ankyrin repeat protein
MPKDKLKIIYSGSDDGEDEFQLTEFSSTTVLSAFSEGENESENYNAVDRIIKAVDADIILDEIVGKSKRKMGKNEKIVALEALFEDDDDDEKNYGKDNLKKRKTSFDDGSEFHKACQYGQKTRVEKMLEKNRDLLNYVDNMNNTALHIAALHNQSMIVKLLLNKGADPTFLNLLEEKAIDLSRSVEIEWALLFMESLWRNETFKLIDGNDKMVDSNDVAVDEDGNTILHYAAVRNKRMPPDMALDDSNLNKINKDGNTPLHLACIFECFTSVNDLLSLGADYENRRNADGKSCMELALRDGSKRLQKCFESLKKTTNTTSSFGREERKMQKILKKLFNKEEPDGAKVDKLRSLTNPGNLSSSASKKKGKPELLNSKKNANGDALDSKRKNGSEDFIKIDKSSGRSQLHRLARRGTSIPPELYPLLNPSLVNLKDNGGYTALHEASLNGNIAIVRELLLLGAQVNAKALNGDTALHDAVENEHFEVIETLLEAGASLKIKNESEKTPVDVANHSTFKLINSWEKKRSAAKALNSLLSSSSNLNVDADQDPIILFELARDSVFLWEAQAKQIHREHFSTAPPNWKIYHQINSSDLPSLKCKERFIKLVRRDDALDYLWRFIEVGQRIDISELLLVDGQDCEDFCQNSLPPKLKMKYLKSNHKDNVLN